MNIVYFACKDDREAQKIANSIISGKLAFCANIIPQCYSIYRWKGNVAKSKETLVVVKTLPHLVKKLIKQIKKLHSYQLPEIVTWKINDASSEILSWASDELKPL